MAGRHRRPPAWRRAFSTSLRRLVRSRDDVRTAALEAEVVALRATVAELRADLETALARSAELSASLAQARADATAAEAVAAEAAAQAAAVAAVAAAAEPELDAAPPVVSLQLPLVRMALTREAEPALTREMALALAAPDRGADTARTEIVLRDLPEHPLLDPTADRDDEPVDHAAEAPREETARRIA